MARFNLYRSFLLLAGAGIATAATEPTVIEYSDINDTEFDLMGYMTRPESADPTEKFPAVVILPDWDNVNEYEITRAKMISEELGYVAFTADIYGADMHDIQDFNVKVERATFYRSNFDIFNSRIQSAIDVVKSMQHVDASKVAVIGYCLGGSGVLGYSFANTVDSDNGIVGAVSFHGGLMDFEVEGSMASPVLVLSGGNDDAGTAVEDLESRLKEANSTWQITRYSGVFHGFTKFDSDAYNEWVDMRSWMEMSTFLKERFGEMEYGTTEPTLDVEYEVKLAMDEDSAVERMAEAEKVMVETVAYEHDGFALEGYLALPPMSEGEKRPALVILPDWDGASGPTGYEAERAVLAAKEGGYVAMVADIYGTEYTNVDDFTTRVELSTFYRSDPELYVSRIQAGIDQLMAHEAVDTSKIFVAGYCFGGTGAIDYAFSEGALENVKAVVPLHGGLTPLRAVQTDAVKPYVLIHSGGVDDAHGNTTELEAHLDGASATWEITRYSYAQHGFTKWGTGDFSPYQAMADSRSWMSMMSLMETLSKEEEKTDMTDMTDMTDTTDMTDMTGEEMESHDGEHDEGSHDDKDHDSHDHDHDHSEMEGEMDDQKMDSSANGLPVFASVVLASLFAALAC